MKHIANINNRGRIVKISSNPGSVAYADVVINSQPAGGFTVDAFTADELRELADAMDNLDVTDEVAPDGKVMTWTATYRTFDVVKNVDLGGGKVTGDSYDQAMNRALHRAESLADHLPAHAYRVVVEPAKREAV